MHELPYAQTILRVALEHAERAGATRIVALEIVVGELSTVVDDTIQYYWDIISEGTIAEGAELRFRRIPALLRCWDCGTQFRLDGEHLACPNCGSRKAAIIQGEEFNLESIEVE